MFPVDRSIPSFSLHSQPKVTETVYNVDGRVKSVKRAVGTALAQTYAASTYTPNGLPAPLTDARGNLTTYQYDGHDRKVMTRYPNAADIH